MTFITETTCIPKTLYEKLMKAFRPNNKENSQRDHRLDYTLDDTLDYTLAEDEEYAQDGMAEPDQYKYVMKTLWKILQICNFNDQIQDLYTILVKNIARGPEEKILDTL